MNNELLTKTLKSVSRSFYLSLRVLPATLRPAMGLGYLLCRAADTIADTDIVPAAERLNLLRQLSQLMNKFPLAPEQINNFDETLKKTILDPKTKDGLLLLSFKDSIEILLTLSHTDQILVQEIVRGVIEGMRSDLTVFGEPPAKEAPPTLTAFSTQLDLENYLGWIGGEPGRFWTKVCLEHEPRLKIKNPVPWTQDGIRFGKGLQMVNILRDIPEDLVRGRCYIPQDLLKEQGLEPLDLLEAEAHLKFLPLYHRLIEDTVKRMESGLHVLQEIPVSHFRLRAAIWWPLALGMMTLKVLRLNYNVFKPEGTRKIKRWAVWGVIGTSPFILSSGKILGKYFEHLRNEASSS